METAESIRVLVVDDEPAAAAYIAQLVSQEGQQVDVANCLTDAQNLLKNGTYHLVLCDIRLDHEDGTAILPHVKQFQPSCLTVFITGFGSMDSAVKAIHEGAFDYISKPIDLSEIDVDVKNVVGRAVRHCDALISQSAAAIPISSEREERRMVGRAPVMINVYRALARAALTRANVLITGESGTGKELVAHAIHEKSPWASKPFVTVNCCALAENLLESELFGHVRGAFTGAVQNKRGLFEEADGGTLFLDEIGDISLGLQVKLLRAIQEGEIKPVGSNEVRKVSVRIITATHRNLPQYVQEGKFREDLYYRMKVISIEMPPLRDRIQDLPELVSYFASRYAQRAGKTLSGVSDEAMAFLLKYPWPGNVRELENAIGRAAAMSTTPILFPEDFPPEISLGPVEAVAAAPAGGNAPIPQQNVATPMVPRTQTILGESLEDLERRHIAQTLQSVGYNKSRAADILGIDRVTLYRKAFKYGLISKGATRKGGSAEPTES